MLTVNRLKVARIMALTAAIAETAASSVWRIIPLAADQRAK
jgi:hypothetical protein